MSRIAEKPKYGTSSQRDRHVDVQRSLCGSVERTAGQSRTHHEGTRRKKWSAENNDRGMGKWESLSHNRTFSRPCGSPRYRNSDTLTEKIAGNGKNLENFGKIFFAETLQNKESGDFSERIFNYFTEFSYPPIAKHRIRCYNIKHNGLQKRLTASTSLTANLTKLDLLLGLTIPRVGILTSGSSQPEGRTLT